jgi:hypothetical protein
MRKVKFIGKITFLLIASIVLFNSCKKEVEETKIDPQMESKQSIGMRNSDSLYNELIADTNFIKLQNYSEDIQALIVKILDQNVIPLTEVDLYNNKNEILNAINVTAEEYDLLQVKFKESAALVVTKYGFNNLNSNCTLCEMSLDQKIEEFRSLLVRFSENRDELNNLFGKIKVGSTSGQNGPGTPDCNNLQFYMCGTLCALTIEAPPVFALCLAYCTCQHCTNPPELCNIGA